MKACNWNVIKSGPRCDVWKTECGKEYSESNIDPGLLNDEFIFCPWCGLEIGDEINDNRENN